MYIKRWTASRLAFIALSALGALATLGFARVNIQLSSGVRMIRMGSKFSPSRMLSRQTVSRSHVQSDLVNRKMNPTIPDDFIGRIANAEKEKIFEDIKSRFINAQETLETLKSKLQTIPEIGAIANKKKQSRRGKFAHQMLHSSLELEAGLREHWYPVEFVSKLDVGQEKFFDMFDEQYVVRRGSKDTYTVENEAAEVMPASVKDGIVWVYPGSKEPPSVPDSAPPKGYVVHAELEMEVPVEHGLLMENLLDLAHAPFTHTSTFAKGWSIPDSVKFHAKQSLSGSWDPYPIDMAFDIPCMVKSTIGLVQVGKAAINLNADECSNHLHQLHACIPSGRGKTRLLYRMSLDMDSLHWTKQIPGVTILWKAIAEQVLGEDTALVLGQQDRMTRGANTWENPVSYDKLGVRYRRWRNSLDSTNEQEKKEAIAAVKKGLSAGELFKIEDDTPL